MNSILQDVRYGARALARNPGFTALAVAAVALGIGPNSAIFSMVSALLLRPLPIKDSDRVVMVWETLKSRDMNQIPASDANFLDWKSQNHVFEKMGTVFSMPEFGFNVVAGGKPERVPGARASADWFEVLGAKPSLGRGFLPEEDRPGAPPVVVASHGYWRTRLESDPRALGRGLTVDGVSRTLVGVLPPEFEALIRADLWIPTAIGSHGKERLNRTYGVMARLKPGITIEQAREDIAAIAKGLARQYPETNDGWGATVTPVQELVTGRIAPALMILLGAVGLLLVLACSNVSGLLLARASAREREIAIRAALGAGRWRIVRQLLTESVILSLLGGALGLALAYWCVNLVRGVIPDYFAVMKQMSIDWRVVAFTAGISALTGVIFGSVPALKLSQSCVSETLKASGRSLIGASVQRIRSVLVVAEVALALMLTVGAGLLVRSFVRLMSVDPGLRTQNVLTMQLKLPRVRYPDEGKRAQFYKNLIERLEALPGVNSAGAIHFLPFRSSILSSRISVWPFVVEGHPPVRRGQEPIADARIVTPRFFRTLGIPLRNGRYFDDRDEGKAPPVVIINEAMARRHFRGESPIGRRLRLTPFDQPGREIVGVVADVKLYFLDWAVEPAIYLPHQQRPNDVMSLVVHSSQNPLALAAVIQREVRDIDPEQPVADVRSMEAVVSDSLMLRRVATAFLGAFALLALVLATVGVYGLTAYSVSRRTHEIGLRIALGARALDIFRLVVGRGLVLAAAGIGIGMAGAFAVGRVLKSLLFGITSADPVVMTGVPLALLTVSALACYLPALRATRVDPAVALRNE